MCLAGPDEREKIIPAYVFVELLFTDDSRKMRYHVENVAATIFAHGGKYHFFDPKVEVLENDIGTFGDKTPHTVLIEFPRTETVRTWFDSDEYQTILPNRLDNSKANILVMEGEINLPAAGDQPPG